MKPYDKNFILEKIREYNEKIHEGKVNHHEILKIDGRKRLDSGYLYEHKESIDEDILELFGNDKFWMRLGPKEIESSYGIINAAHGRVGIVGLGLGYIAQEMAKNNKVSEVVVYEFEKDIIELYKKNFGENEKIKIINEDAYKIKGEKFDYFYVDIYEYKLTEQVVSDYKHFNDALEIEDYVFWGVEHFLLSCRYEEIVWVYIPENWMEMSKDAYRALGEEGLLNYYSQIDEELVSSVLARFKPVLEELG